MNRRLIFVVITVLAVAGGSFFLAKRLRAGSAAAGETQYKIVKAQKGEVRKTVSSTGTLQAWDVVDIKARAGGELTQLAVDVGSMVKKGQVLARIDPLDVQLSLNTARADETSARAKEKQSDATYHLQTQQGTIAVRDAEAALSSARANVQAARARLDAAQKSSQAQPELTRSAIANAQATYQQAVEQRRQLDATSPQQQATAQSAYDQAVANRVNARLGLERQQALLAKGFVSQQAVDTNQASLAVYDAQVAGAKAKLDTVAAELRANIDAADARVRQTRAALESAKANSIDVANRGSAVQEARAAVSQAQAQVARSAVALDQAKANLAQNQIRQYDVQQASASIARAEASRINAQTTLERTVVRAPADGIVLSKSVEQGTIIQSGLSLSSAGTSIMQLGNIDRMYVDVLVDETDIASVDEGQKVDVAIEAYPGVPFQGTVRRVDPQALVVQNVTSVHVRVEIDNSAPTFRLLKPGMNATCQFVISDKTDVISVPNEAVHEDDKGRYVETASGGKPAPADAAAGTPADPTLLTDITKNHVPVEVGLAGNDATEITSGIKEGDTVITQTIEPVTSAAPAQGSPFGGGNVGGRGFGGGGGGGRGR